MTRVAAAEGLGAGAEAETGPRPRPGGRARTPAAGSRMRPRLGQALSRLTLAVLREINATLHPKY